MSCLQQHKFIILSFYEIKVQHGPKSRCREDSALLRLEKRIQLLVVFNIFRPPTSFVSFLPPLSLQWTEPLLSTSLRSPPATSSTVRDPCGHIGGLDTDNNGVKAGVGD